MTDPERLVRYYIPTKLDKAFFGTRWLFVGDNKNSDLFIQISEDENEPHWVRMETFLEHVFKEFFSDEKFIVECLRLYKSKGPKTLRTINNIINEC